MKEIEIKFLEIDKEALITKLKTKGAIQTYEGLMKVAYFDHADKRIQKANELLRLRDIGNGQVEVVYKANPQVKDGFKIYDEYEVMSENFDTLSQIFEKAGLHKSMYYEKKRTQYEYLGVKFEIDQYPKIPAYLELEMKNPEILDQIIEEFNLEKYERTNITCTEVFAKKYPEIELNGLVF